MPVDSLKDAAEQLANLFVMCEPDDAVSLEALAVALERAGELAEGDVDLQGQLRHAASLARRIAEGQVGDGTALFVVLSASVNDAREQMTGRAGSQTAFDQPEDSLVAEFISRAFEHLDDADEQLLTLERDPSDHDALNSVFRSFHTIKGMTGFLSLGDIQEIAHGGEALLEPARRSAQPLDPAVVDAVFGAVDQLRLAVRSLASNGGGAEGGVACNAEAARQAGEATPSAHADVIASTVRVDAGRLDQLLDAVGELVIAESMVSSLARAEAAAAPGLMRQLGRLDKLMRQLHEMAGSLRMVPLRPTFQRLARAVRDVSHKAEKSIDLVMTGQETELDRAVVDRIEDPLLHLVRNAVDHGIEPDSNARIRAGKPPVGRVELRAYHKAGNIFVEVEDDGRGLDREKITERAIALGHIAADQAIPDKDLLNLIFLPGLSTSETVTDVSGRGVGMDVVKRTVDSLAGQITIKSEPGRGTTFVIRLPITLAVIDGMAVRVGDDRYIVPTLSVIRSVRPDAAEVSTVLGSGEVLQHEEELLRLIRLAEIFEVDCDNRKLDESIVMVVEDDGQRAGLVIDEIIGQQQIVIKSLGDALGEVSGVSGGAVMPDGRVGLILDVEGLVELANSN